MKSTKSKKGKKDSSPQHASILIVKERPDINGTANSPWCEQAYTEGESLEEEPVKTTVLIAGQKAETDVLKLASALNSKNTAPRASRRFDLETPEDFGNMDWEGTGETQDSTSLLFKPKPKVDETALWDELVVTLSIADWQAASTFWDSLTKNHMLLQKVDALFWAEWVQMDRAADLLAKNLSMNRKIDWLIITIRTMLHVAATTEKKSETVKTATLMNRLWLTSEESINSFRDTFINVLTQITNEEMDPPPIRAWSLLIDSAARSIMEARPDLERGEPGVIYFHSTRSGKWTKHATKLTIHQLHLYNVSGSIKKRFKTIDLTTGWAVDDFTNSFITPQDYAFTLDPDQPENKSIHLAAESKQTYQDWRRRLQIRFEACAIYKEVFKDVAGHELDWAKHDPFRESKSRNAIAQRREQFEEDHSSSLYSIRSSDESSRGSLAKRKKMPKKRDSEITVFRTFDSGTRSNRSGTLSSLIPSFSSSSVHSSPSTPGIQITRDNSSKSIPSVSVGTPPGGGSGNSPRRAESIKSGTPLSSCQKSGNSPRRTESQKSGNSPRRTDSQNSKSGIGTPRAAVNNTAGPPTPRLAPTPEAQSTKPVPPPIPLELRSPDLTSNWGKDIQLSTSFKSAKQKKIDPEDAWMFGGPSVEWNPDDPFQTWPIERVVHWGRTELNLPESYLDLLTRNDMAGKRLAVTSFEAMCAYGFPLGPTQDLLEAVKAKTQTHRDSWDKEYGLEKDPIGRASSKQGINARSSPGLVNKAHPAGRQKALFSKLANLEGQ